MRAGFVALAGRPNVGKSTLVNAIVGQKVAIVSDKPQTTRRAVRGVATRADWQLVLTDLPGVQKPRDALTQRMQRRVERELTEADAALLVVDAEAGIGPGDRFLARLLAPAGLPVAVAVNKVDRVHPGNVAAALTDAEALGISDELFPVSARKGTGVPALAEHLAGLMPESPQLFGPEDLSVEPLELRIAELVREQVLRRTFQEVPHAVAVEVADVEHPRDGLLVVRADVLVETESQKGILIGKHGKMVRAIGTAARRELERELADQVHLELSVQVRSRWRGDDALLDRLGIE